MILAYINKIIPVPNIEDHKTLRELVGNTWVTKGGKRVRWASSLLHSYEVRCEELTKLEYDPIVAYLDGILLTETLYWYRDFGGDAASNSRKVLIDITEDSAATFVRDGVYHCDGHSITLLVQEVE